MSLVSPKVDNALQALRAVCEEHGLQRVTICFADPEPENEVARQRSWIAVHGPDLSRGDLLKSQIPFMLSQSDRLPL